MRDRVLWFAVAAYTVIFSVLGALKYNVHRNFVDFGIFAQTAASAFGCFCNAVEGSHYAVHFSPILYIAGAVVWFWHSPYALIALQSIACAMTLPPIYSIVERSSGRNTARLAALVVFLFPALAGLTFNDFHENDFAPAAVAWLLWAFDGGYVVATYAFAAIVLCIKEDQAVFLIAAGAAGYARFRGTTYGRLALFVAIAALIVARQYFWHIQPAAATQAHWAPVRFYAWDAADVRGLFLSGILQRLGFVVLAFLPLLFLPFRSRWMWLAALPLAEVLLSRMSTTFTLGSHYAGAWIGWVLVAFALAVRRLPEAGARRALAWCAALCVLELLVANPLHPRMNLRGIEPRDVALDRFLATLPKDVPIATQEEAYTHLALFDPFATVLPESATLPVTTPFALIDRAFPDSPRLQEFGAALRPPCFVPVVRSETIALYRARCVGALRSSASASMARSGHRSDASMMREGAAHGIHRAV